MTEPVTKITRPQSPSAADNHAPSLKPEEYNPEMAQASMVKEMVARFPTPAILTKQFVFYQALWEGLNNTTENKTYLDTSLRLAVYRSGSRHSVNADGALFKSFWAYCMHPTYQIIGMPQYQPGEADQPGLIRRMINKVTGRGQEAQPQ